MPGLERTRLFVFLGVLGATGAFGADDLGEWSRRVGESSLDRNTRRKAYRHLVDHVARQVDQGRVSACAAASFAMEHYFRLTNGSLESFAREALVVFGDPGSVRPQLARLQSLIRKLPSADRCAQDPPLLPPPSAKAWGVFRDEWTGGGAPSPAWPAWLSAHGDSAKPDSAQGLRRGYAQEDFDATGRHDHLLFNMYLQRSVDRLRECSALPVPVEGLIRILEHDKERYDARAFFLRHGAKLLEDPAFWEVYAPERRSSVKQAVRRLLVLPREKKAAAGDPRRLKALEKEENAVLNALASRIDVEMNRHGRRLFEQLSARPVSAPVFGALVFERLCDESWLEKNRLIRERGPLTLDQLKNER